MKLPMAVSNLTYTKGAFSGDRESPQYQTACMLIDYNNIYNDYPDIIIITDDNQKNELLHCWDGYWLTREGERDKLLKEDPDNYFFTTWRGIPMKVKELTI